MRTTRTALFGAMFVLATTVVQAHDARPVVIELAQTESWRVAVRIKLPASLAPGVRPAVALPDDCVAAGESLAYPTPGAYLRETYHQCARSLGGRSVGITYPVMNPSISSLFKLTLSNGQVITKLLPPGTNRWQVPMASTFTSVARDYMSMGITHIWRGLDHLLFVLCLLFVARTKWRVIAAISAFTVGHSLTLALAALGYLRLSIGAVEVLIALSLVFLASEIVRENRDSLTWRHPSILAGAFGLLHGLGFATALGELGLPSVYRLQALAFFNIGVELGQLLFILGVFALVALPWPKSFALIRFETRTAAALAPAYAIGVVSAYWVVQRSVAILNP